MTNNAQLMINAMLEASENYPLLPGLVYCSPFDFVARHGCEHLVAGPCRVSRGADLQCFANALICAGMYGLRYVEGFALAPNGNMIFHAWNLDPAGSVHDSTWMNTGLAYVGVEFSVERADDALWNGDACVLNDEHRKYPIYQKPWIGEDYSLLWPVSDRLEALRRCDPVLAVSCLQFIAQKPATE